MCCASPHTVNSAALQSMEICTHTQAQTHILLTYEHSLGPRLIFLLDYYNGHQKMRPGICCMRMASKILQNLENPSVRLYIVVKFMT